VPLAIEVVEAMHGRRLDVAWELGPSAPEEERTGRGTSARTVSTSASQDLERTFQVEVPQGLAAWDEPRIHVTVARRARTLRHVHPLRPEAVVHLTARRADGSPAGDAAVTARVAGRGVAARWNVHRGAGAVAGVPFLCGERIAFDVTEMEPRDRPPFRAWVGSWEGRLGTDPREQVTAVVSLSAEPGSAGSLLGTGGGAGGAFKGRGRIRVRDEAGQRGGLEVTVLGRGGAPLVDTLVRPRDPSRTARTDARGQVTFDDVPTGEREVETYEPGVLTARDTVRVAAGATSRATLREPEGGTLEVEVVDGEGVGLPFATVSVGSSSYWLDVDDEGVQRTDPYTDAHGRRRLHHVPAGPVGVGAAFGERALSERVEVAEGSVTPLRLVLR
jgi:hypothetical protein